MTDPRQSPLLTGCHVSACRTYPENDGPCGNCPPVPSDSELDQPYCTEDGDVMWLLKTAGDKVRSRTDAIREAIGYGVADEWTDARCRTVWMKPWYGPYEHGIDWGVRSAEQGEPEAREFWEVRHHAA